MNDDPAEREYMIAKLIQRKERLDTLRWIAFAAAVFVAVISSVILFFSLVGIVKFYATPMFQKFSAYPLLITLAQMLTIGVMVVSGNVFWSFITVLWSGGTLVVIIIEVVSAFYEAFFAFDLRTGSVGILMLIVLFAQVIAFVVVIRAQSKISKIYGARRHKRSD